MALPTRDSRLDTVDPAHRLTVLLAEYQELKGEQRGRIESRDALVYTSLAVTAAVIAAVTQTHLTLLLLALPAAGVPLGWTYLAKARMVAAIGRYLREDLRPQLEPVAGPVLGWEFDHPGDRRRRQRKRIQAAVDVATFCLPGAVAIIVCLVLAGTPLAFVVGATELAALAALAWQILVYAKDIRPAFRGPTEQQADSLDEADSGR